MVSSRLLIAGAGAALMLLAGCGSSSSSSSSASSSAPSSSTQSSSSGAASSASGAQVDAAFAAQANALCNDATTRSKAVTLPGDPTAATADQLSGWASYFEKVNAISDDLLSKLEALPPPAQGADGFGMALTQARLLQQDAHTAGAAANSGDLAGFKAAVSKLVQDNGVANQAFDSIGLKPCGSGSS